MAEEAVFTSALGRGVVQHSRHAPKKHALTVPLMMPLLDLDNVSEDLAASRFWSNEKANVASFKREDHYGSPDIPLQDLVRKTLLEQTGITCDGSVHILCNLRYCGYVFNPITLYFCSDCNGQPVGCVAEVMNIPWKQHVLYAMPIENENSMSKTCSWQHNSAKRMHVSPFMPMEMDYQWRISYSQKNLVVHIQNQPRESSEQHRFDATLNLKWQPLTASNLNTALLQYPLQTVRTVAGIHWHALKLWLKGMPYLPHPHKGEDYPSK